MKTHAQLGHDDRGGGGAADRGAAGSCTTTSGSTAAATPPGWRATRSRWSRGSSWWPTPSRRSPPTAPTGSTARSTRRSRSCGARAGTQFDARCVAALERAIGHRGLLAA